MLALTVPLERGAARVRPYRLTDADALAPLANDAEVARHLLDRFPHPYTLEDARSWTTYCAAQAEPDDYALEVDGQLAGGIGLTRGQDVYRLSAEIGYWLGRAYWGRGVASAVVRAFSERVFERTPLVRLEARVFATNRASMRVLHKAGFVQEGVLRKAVVKHGALLDVVLFARLKA